MSHIIELLQPRSGDDGGSRTSLTLLDAARSGDGRAWRQTVELYGPLIFRWARASGLQDADAADVVQSTFNTMLRKLESFEHRDFSGSFRGWLWAVTRSRIADLGRRRHREPPGAGGTEAYRQLHNASAEGLDPPTDVESDRIVICRQAMQMVRPEFEEKTWTAFWRSTVEEHPTDLIAADLGVSKWAIYKARARVLQRLRETLGDTLM